jgi:hypothetical protein
MGDVAPDEARSFRVFAQQEAPYLDVAALAVQARRFFEASVEVTGGEPAERPYAIATRLSVVADAGGGGTRRSFARMCDAQDWAAAEQTEASAGYTGLSLLARRCASLWIVEAEAPDDAVALRISAVLASLFLGPILSPGGAELFGVHTARARLEGNGQPYR